MIKFDKAGKNTKILFICPFIPYPLDDGLKIRAFHTIKELLNEGHEITLACFTKENDANNIKNLKKEINIDLFNVPFDLKYFNTVSHIYYSLFSKYPFYIISMYKTEFKKMIKTLNNNFDLVYIFDRSMVLYGNDIEINIPKILDSVDSQSLNSMSGFKSSENIIYKIFWYISYIKSKMLEKKLYNKFDHIITISERDAEQLRKMSCSKIVNIPSGVDLSYFKPDNLEKIPYSITFLGTMDAFSNQQAVLYFYKNIFPSIKQKFPSVKLFIIGRNPPMKISELNDQTNIFVTGYVEDIQSYINKSEIIISPLQMASGLQTKLLVSMAMNKPIISTMESIGEINKFIHEKDILIANNPEEFIQHILNLFSNKNLLQEIGKNGRNIIKKNYSWEAFGFKINQIIKEL